MLPGFRVLFAALVLSMSILVFGLGATALLRTAQDEFANTPSWQPAPETRFAQQNDATTPVLAMLRVDEAPVTELPASDNPASDNAAAMAAPAEQKLPDDVATPAQPASAGSTPVEAEKIAALNPEQSSPPEAVKPEIVVPEAPDQAGVTPGPAEAPVAAEETKIAATQAVPPEKEAAPVGGAEEAAPIAPEQASVPGSPASGSASTKIAALGGPPVVIETKPPTKATAGAKPDKSAIKKRQDAQRAIKRRRIALRARLAAQAAQQSSVRSSYH
jgi:hypothetical protein